MLRPLWLAPLAVLMIFVAEPASARVRCGFPHGDKTSVAEMLASIRVDNAACALPWRAMKAAVRDPVAKQQLLDAYDQVAAAHAARAIAVRARKADVEAADGHPQEMLAIADANVLAHPEDKSLANMSCFARGRYGFDVGHAMAYCDAAVNGLARAGYTLLNRGRVELDLGQFQAAFADFNEAIGQKDFQQHPMLMEAVYGRGLARLGLGDADGARDIAIAARALPEVVEAFEDGGVSHAPGTLRVELENPDAAGHQPLPAR